METNSVNFLEAGFWLGSFTIFTISLISNYSVGVVPPTVLQFIRYGRLNITRIKTNSILTAIEVPKRWFAHFYFSAVLIQSMVLYVILNEYLLPAYRIKVDALSLLVTKIINALGGNMRTQNVDATTTIVAASLYLAHLLRRFYESSFISVYSNTTKMNFFVYIMSHGYYFAAVLSIIASSPGFCSQHLENDFSISIKAWTGFQTLGLVLYLYGTLEQHRAHVGFANLRKGDDRKIVSLNHRIPTGGLFELISSPNYYAEILIYIGLAIILKLQNHTWNSVTVWVLTSQILAGIMNHRWYVANFSDYPKQRKAIIPYIL